jgi:hypothetical protein
MLTRRSVLGLSIVLSAAAASVPARASDDVPTFADRSDRDIEDTDRTWGILFNPLAIAVGVYGGDVDFVLGRHFAASVEGALYDLNGTTATAFGGGLLFYPNVAFHGLYLEPRVAYARPMSEGLLHFDLSSDVFGAGATAGWQWTWDYGFTVRLGAGGMYFVGGSSPTPNAVALSGPQLVMDGSLGWTF